MRHESLVNEDWTNVVVRLGGTETLEETARETKAFLRPRGIRNAVDLLRLILAYCLGERGLRSTAAWATSVGLVDISNVGLLYRLRHCGDWLALLVGQALAAVAPKASEGRLIRIIDATTVPKKGTAARKKNELWRIHCAFDLPQERFGHVELTDQREGETLDRIPPIAGEIRLADRAYLQPDRMAKLIRSRRRCRDPGRLEERLLARRRGQRSRSCCRVTQGVSPRAHRSTDLDKAQTQRASCRASGRDQEAGAGGCRSASQGTPSSPARRSPALEANT